MYVKERVIQAIQEAHGERVCLRTLIKSFDRSRRAQARQVISDLVAQGFLNPLGAGRRGSPHSIIASPIWPYDRCPMCGQQASQDVLLPSKMENK